MTKRLGPWTITTDPNLPYDQQILHIPFNELTPRMIDTIVEDLGETDPLDPRILPLLNYRCTLVGPV